MEKLSVYIGEPVREVLAQNRRTDFDVNRYDDDIPVIWPVDDSIPQVFNYTYNDPQGAVSFSHARLVWVTQFAGVVTDVLVSTSESKLTLSQFYDDLSKSADEFTRQGWIASGPLISLDALRSSVENSRANSLEGGLAGFRKGSVTAVLSLKGFSQSPGDASAGSSDYVLNIQFSDAAMHDILEKKVYAERQRVNGTVYKSLKLSYWLKQKQ